jgi:rhodanese-related sulfurtransferase
MSNKKSGTITKRMAKRAEQRRKKRQTQIIIAAAAILFLAVAAWLVFGADTAATEPEVAQMPLPSNITVDEGYQRYQDGDFFLDVRTQEEWDEYHIPGTTLIPLDQLESRVSEVPRDRDVVVVCRSGNRSQVGRDTLLDAGFTTVTSMDGGVSTWRDAGYPTE